MPLIGGAVSNAWYRTGRFLGPNITEFYRRYPLPVQVRMVAGGGDPPGPDQAVHRCGAAVVTWARQGEPAH